MWRGRGPQSNARTSISTGSSTPCSRTAPRPRGSRRAGLADLAAGTDAHGRDSFLDGWSEAGADHEWSEERFELAEDGDGGVTLRAPLSAAPALRKQYRVG